MFERKHPGPEYNEIVAKQLANDPLARVRTEHPDLFPKTPQGERLARATTRSSKERPPQKQTSTWKFLILAALAGFAGGKMAQPSEHARNPPAQGFPITESMPATPPTPAPQDIKDLEAPLAAAAHAEQQALFQSFQQNYLEVLKTSKKAYEAYSGLLDLTGAFFLALTHDNIDVTDKTAVRDALHNEKIIGEVFSRNNFPQLDEKQLSAGRAEFIELLEGTAI